MALVGVALDGGGFLVDADDGADVLLQVQQEVAGRAGALVPVYGLSSGEVADGASWDPVRLVAETSLSINTAAAGGNASLMTIG